MSARLVVDASVTIAWLLDEDRSALGIRKILERHLLVAPTLWQLEVANAILSRERRKLLSASQSAALLKLVEEIQIELFPERESQTIASLVHLARPYQLTAYDAMYLDLAIRLELPLFTRDSN